MLRIYIYVTWTELEYEELCVLTDDSNNNHKKKINLIMEKKINLW